MKISALNGFTLVELLVVVAIMAITGVFAFANFASFGEDKKLTNTTLEIQSLLKTAQTNAISNVKCSDDSFNAIWKVEFLIDNKTINLKCNNDSPIKTVTLDKISANISIDSVSGQTSIPSSECPDLPFTTTFDRLTGKIKVEGEDYKDCIAMTVVVKNSKITTGLNTKSLKIEKGGRIYVE